VCFELDSVPPIAVIPGAAVFHDDLVLESADGTKLAAFAATPDEPKRAGVVILPDVRGLYRFYEELALRFAERGYPAIAPTTSDGPPSPCAPIVETVSALRFLPQSEPAPCAG